jgi:hypothetical protein
MALHTLHVGIEDKLTGSVLIAKLPLANADPYFIEEQVITIAFQTSGGSFQPCPDEFRKRFNYATLWRGE